MTAFRDTPRKSPSLSVRSGGSSTIERLLLVLVVLLAFTVGYGLGQVDAEREAVDRG